MLSLITKYLNFISSKNNKHSYLLDLSIIFIILSIFNYYLVFAYDFLFQDDLTFYSHAVEYSFPFWPEGKRPVLTLFKSFIFHIPIYELMQISPKISRAVILFLEMIPLSFLFYLLLFKVFEWNRFISICIAVLPNILPNEVIIPFFINGSYVVIGALFMTFGIIIFYIALTVANLKNKKILIVLSIFMVYFSSVSMEQSVFYIPALLSFSLFICKKFHYKRFALIFSVTGTWMTILISKLVYVKLNPRATHSNQFLPTDEIINRSIKSFDVNTPFPLLIKKILSYLNIEMTNQPIIILFLIIILLSGILLFIQFFRKKAGLESDFLIWLFFLTFSLAHLFPFLTMSPFNGSRYYYISSFPVISLILFSTFILYKLTLFRPQRKKLSKLVSTGAIFVLFLVVFLSGIFRVKKVKAVWTPKEKVFQNIKEQLAGYNFPVSSQIVLLGSLPVNTGGYFIWSSGYLKYITKRNDITGVMPKIFNFYNAFNINHRGYCWTMSGLDINKPVFIFKYSNRKWKHLKYGLQWMQSNVNKSNLPHCKNKREKIRFDMESKWILYKFNLLIGNTTVLKEGIGMESYLDYLKKENISFNEIAWGKKNLKK